MRRLLKEFDTIFDLSYRIGEKTLGELVERTIAGLEPAALEDMGSEGRRDEVVVDTGRSVSFYYRPHLFPGMDLKLRLAHGLQYQLLPRELPPESPVSISAVLESYCHLSGDLFGWEILRDGKLLIWIADMAGHGIRAGLASAVLHVLARNLRERGRVELFLTELNRALHHCLRPSHDGLYATVFCMTLDAEGAALYGSAGHTPVLLLRGRDGIEELEALDRPIRLFPDTTYRSTEFRMHPGDHVFLYTDGLIEATGFDNEPFGVERLRAVLAQEFGGPREMTSAVYGELTCRQDIDKLEDDVTFLAAKL